MVWLHFCFKNVAKPWFCSLVGRKTTYFTGPKCLRRASTEQVWSDLGCIFDPQRLHSGSDVTLLPRLPSLLLSTSSFLTPSFLSFLPPLSSPQETMTPRSQERKQPRNVATQKPTHLGSAGARVSAYNLISAAATAVHGREIGMRRMGPA